MANVERILDVRESVEEYRSDLLNKIAAKIIGAESCNGWTYWHYNANGNMIPIDDLRRRLISKNNLI